MVAGGNVVGAGAVAEERLIADLGVFAEARIGEERWTPTAVLKVSLVLWGTPVFDASNATASDGPAAGGLRANAARAPTCHARSLLRS